MTMNTIDPQTGLTEDSNLKDRACALAMAQCTSVAQPHTWLEAYHELEELSEGDEPQSFVVGPWLEDESWSSVYSHVQHEADAIGLQLQAAFVMGIRYANGN